jgi:hypothetical protein
MAVTATRRIAIELSGDLTAGFTFSAADNTASPAQIDIVTLASGANTITPPTGGSTPKSCTIIPPSGNINTITLKGITGDTGVVLHLTDPTTIALNSPTAVFVLTASAIITGVRLVWT